VWNNKETSAGKSVQFRLELDPGSLTFLLKPALLFGLLSLYPLRSSALEAKYCDNDFVDEEDEARSSSGVLILALGCDISAPLEPHLKENLSPGFTLDPHETQNSAILDAAKWRKQTLTLADCWRK